MAKANVIATEPATKLKASLEVEAVANMKTPIANNTPDAESIPILAGITVSTIKAPKMI
jgi:hypothetical protein